MSSPLSSYTTAVSAVPSLNWQEPFEGPESFPPAMGYDAFAVVNPDYWEDGADINKFTGWMNFTEVSTEALLLM